MEMPIMTSFLDEEWESLCKMFSSEDADFMLQQLHGHELLSSNECDGDGGSFVGTPPNFWHVNQSNIQNVAGFGESFLCYDDTLDYANFQNISQESSYSSGSDNSVVLPNLSHGFHLANDIHIFQVQNDSTQSMDFCVMDEQNDNTSVRVIHDSVVPDIICPREEKGNDKLANAESQLPASIANSGNALLLKRKFAKAELQIEAEDNKFNDDSVENPKKKSRVSRNAQKNKRNPQQPKQKKNQKSVQIIKDNDEETNAGQNGQSSCSYSSEDDSNASQESNGGGEASDNKEPAALNLNGKTRASRGSATDPQSLYARRRRERINERLRILQNLIPNGTKVDISTMLEEAVHYVKFLQLQIKLLSSDDMWMYAPIVYNGLDIGMCGRIFPTL